MKVFDCITYYDEPLLFEIRLNILDKFVDEFIVSEALFSHSGKKKKLISTLVTILNLKIELNI